MNFINMLIDNLKNMDVKISKLMKFGFTFCFVLLVLSLFILLTYKLLYSHPNLYYIGFSLLKSSLVFAITFFACGIGFNSIKKQLQ